MPPLETVIFIGIPGTGKTTFFRQRFFDTHIRINLDMLRTRQREMILVQACIAAKQSFVVDNTNVTQKERARYIQPAGQASFQVVGYYFESTLEEAIRRNHQRSGRAAIPDKGVRARLNQLERPRCGEGFDKLFCVRIDPATSQFIVEEWNCE